MTNDFEWVDKVEERINTERSKDYFNIQEGKNQFVLLSHCAPLTQVWDNATKRYRVADEGDKNVSIKGVCWVLQEGAIKQAKLPYTVVKQIRALREDPEWDFQIPFLHTLTLTAKGAGTKEVEYTLNPSPKRIALPQTVLDELAKKPTPEAIVDKIKSKTEDKTPEYPDEDLKPEDIPFEDDSF